MTKKTFAAIAAAFRVRAMIKATDAHASPETARAALFETFDCARMFCDIAAQHNPKFDRELRDLCGLSKDL